MSPSQAATPTATINISYMAPESYFAFYEQALVMSDTIMPTTPSSLPPRPLFSVSQEAHFYMIRLPEALNYPSQAKISSWSYLERDKSQR